MPPELIDGPMTSLADSARRLESLVSPFTGIVRGVDDVLAAPDDIRLVSVFCETGYSRDLVGHGTTHRGAGSGRSRAAARAAAVAEAAERYSACDSEDAAVIVASAEELGRAAVTPSRFALFSETQYRLPGFPYERFTEATQLAWIEACSLPEAEPAFVPAQLVFLGWTPRPGEARIARSTSNGLACGASFEEAVLTGLLELLERDAFMIAWKARLSLPRLSWTCDSALAMFEQHYVRPTGLRVAAIDLSAIWKVPTVLGVARSAVSGEAPIGVGACAAIDVERAVEKALDEAVRVRSWARSIRAEDPTGERAPDADEIRYFDEHIRYHAYEHHAAGADFLDAATETRNATDVHRVAGGTPRDHIAAICARLEERGAFAYAVDVTAPDIRAAGLHVARVVAPELCPLDVEQDALHLGGHRLYDEPVRLGIRETRLRESDINLEPHPFP
ncbi:MAG: YcaO-like family protein [Gaiellaceae bacterium]